MFHLASFSRRRDSRSDGKKVTVVVFPGFKRDLWGLFMRIVEAL